MMPVMLPNSTGMRARHFTPVVFALALAGTALVANTVGNWISYSNAPTNWTDVPSAQTVTLGTTSLSIPANMLRNASQARLLGADRTIDLTVLWPSLSGYTLETASAFADMGDHSPVMSISIGTAVGDMDTDQRFSKVWTALAHDEALPGPAGLDLLPLAGDRSSGTDFVAHRADSKDAFAARCFTPRDARLAATCQRTIHSEAGLSISYRFRQTHLSDWRRMDRAVGTLVASFLD